MDTAGEGEGGRVERVAWRHTWACVNSTAGGKLLCNTGLSLLPWGDLEGWDGMGQGWDGMGRGAEVREGGDNVVVWQRPAQHCKAIILQINILKMS